MNTYKTFSMTTLTISMTLGALLLAPNANSARVAGGTSSSAGAATSGSTAVSGAGATSAGTGTGTGTNPISTPASTIGNSTLPPILPGKTPAGQDNTLAPTSPVGTTDSAFKNQNTQNTLTDAQQNYQNALTQYGANSDYTRQAKTVLDSAQKNANNANPSQLKADKPGDGSFSNPIRP